ncbi:hypothetical protein E4T66_01815 [Sinimarinibacterium sp. CAU 1509]|uniref:hypothetical protein n=1 Tax=Sinimarinibacterium sp. CAU 1509 TaxID=2562283 RepID=UPI0010AC622C|nr:hypothetical protein [Sinimarinibacterium sp. CAU 1509]TJY64985.1 hypothetical protein E4T66_01815 [Sinimarinibacterium sp. CAU 1509]
MRRALYGVLLWCSYPALSTANDGGEAPLPRHVTRTLISIERLAAQWVGFDAGYRIDVTRPDPRIAPALDRIAGLLRTQTRYVYSEPSSLLGGIGMDIDLPSSGRLYLRLKPGDPELDQGLRWELCATDAHNERSAVTAGAGLSMVYGATDPRFDDTVGRAELHPQVILDIDRLTDIPGSAELMLGRRSWIDSDGQSPDGRRAWQVVVQWRF